MRTKTVLMACAGAAGLLIAAPSFAQTTTGGGVGASFDRGADDNVIVNDLLDVFAVDNAADTYTSSHSTSYSSDGNTLTYAPVVAYQELKATNINRDLDQVMSFDSEDYFSKTPAGYHSGSQSVNDNAFAAFAGISNAAWNTGVDANTQAATNIAAHGTITFGVGGGAE